MTATSRTISDVREYLRRQVNLALRRPGMYSGEIALRLLFDAMAFTDGREDSLADEYHVLRERGAFLSTGVTGGVENVLGEKTDHVMASVYARIAHRFRWLCLDRELPQAEHRHLLATVRPWCAGDRSHDDVLTEFGPPSVHIGGSSTYPHTFLYATADPDDPVVLLHFWNGTGPGAATWPPTDPLVVLAAQCEAGRFADEFTFTPGGARRPMPS